MKKITPTHIVMAILLIAFAWAQWPSRETTTLPKDPYQLANAELGFEVQFEQKPETLGTQGVTQGFVTERQGLSQMVQVLDREGESEKYWLDLAKRNDQQNFTGEMVLDWQFPKSGSTVYEYALKNELGFVNQVRIWFTDDRVYKWSVAYKDKEDAELQTRILTFLDSFELINKTNR